MKGCNRISAIVFLFIFLIFSSVLAADKMDLSIKPQKNNHLKWRIGYYEGGEFLHYQLNFMATVKGLMTYGWIEPIDIPDQKGEQTIELWKWLVKNVKSDYIEFVKDAHYTANWDDSLIEKVVATIINRLNTKKDIDLMIAAGTTAGRGLSNNKHHTPTIVISSSDPIGAGIVKSAENSGYEHVLARVDPFRYERQIRIFHEIIGFKKLGVAYSDTPNGRTYAAISDIEKISKEYGFEIVRCYTQDEIMDVKVCEESVKNCFRELSNKTDAIYVTAQNGVNPNSIPDLVDIVNKAQIPTFSQSSSTEVKAGFLMSISQATWKYAGDFYAKTIAKTFNGAKIGQLEQVFEDPTKMTINLESAKKISFRFPLDILAGAFEIYETIEEPENQQ
ncbi:ABC transporter substrate binding protein [Desulfobacula sp.]|uniref:ABC transporter substrate-binding protein n=1 Tax=Desulfobacula sp. TaxID=2593537 RepID=UPI00260C4FAD|nr:ABC transporter substrate binding protein [Desulfobacula sp.]